MYVRTYVHTYTIHTYVFHILKLEKILYTHTLFLLVQTYELHTFVFVRMYVRMYVRMCVCNYVCTYGMYMYCNNRYVCTHVYMY